MPIVMMRVRSHISAAVDDIEEQTPLLLMSAASRPVLFAIDAGATGGVHDIIGVPLGVSLACSSETRVTY